jgi:hypothetical protein
MNKCNWGGELYTFTPIAHYGKNMKTKINAKVSHGCDWKISIIKMSLLPKEIYAFNGNSTQIPTFCRNRKNLKICMDPQYEVN